MKNATQKAVKTMSETSEIPKEDARIKRAKHAKHAKFVLSVEFDSPSAHEEETSANIQENVASAQTYEHARNQKRQAYVQNTQSAQHQENSPYEHTRKREENSLNTSDTERIMRVARHARPSTSSSANTSTRTNTPKHARKSSQLVVEFDNAVNKKENPNYEKPERRVAHAKHAASETRKPSNISSEQETPEKGQATSRTKQSLTTEKKNFTSHTKQNYTKGNHTKQNHAKQSHVKHARHENAKNSTNKNTSKTKLNTTLSTRNSLKELSKSTFARVVACACVICALLFVAALNIPAINPATQEEFTVTFDAQGGTSAHFAGAATTHAQAHKNDTYGAALFSDNNVHNALPTSEKTGYTFLGWFTQADGGEQVSASTTINNAQDHTLYAHWKRNSLYM